MYNKVYIEITNICNMTCSFCHGHKRAPRRMSKEEFSVILEKLSGKTKILFREKFPAADAAAQRQQPETVLRA